MKQIPLGKEKFALVDDEDYEFLSKWKWRLSSLGYAVRTVNFRKPDGKRFSTVVFMRREILGLKVGDNLDGDHIKGNRLDNRRCELRVCTRAENVRNRKVQA